MLDMTSEKYLKRLARKLTYKADVYIPGKRIYSHDAKYIVVSPDGGTSFRLLHGSDDIDPKKVYDGNGRNIYVSRDPQRASD